MGLWPFLLALAVLEIAFAPLAWSLLTDLGHDLRRVVFRIAPLTAVAALAVVGLTDAIAQWTFVVGGFVLVTSPLLRGCTQRGFPTRLAARMSPRIDTPASLRRDRRARVRGSRGPAASLIPLGRGASDDETPERKRAGGLEVVADPGFEPG